MDKRITSIRIDWFSNALASSSDELHWRLDVYRNRGVQVYTTYNGIGEKMLEEKYGLHDFQRESVFTALESWEDQSPWSNDYSVIVEDGDEYEILLRFNDRSTKKVKGTEVFPPHWNEFLILLQLMCELPLDGARNEISKIAVSDVKEANDESQAFLACDVLEINYSMSAAPGNDWHIYTIRNNGDVLWTYSDDIHQKKETFSFSINEREVSVLYLDLLQCISHATGRTILYDNGIGTLKITYKNNISHEYDRGVRSAETVIAAIIEGYIHRTLNPQMWKAMQRTKLCYKIEIQSDLWTMVSPKPGEEIHQTLSIARNGEVKFCSHLWPKIYDGKFDIGRKMETTISRNDAISIMGVVTNLFFMRSTEHDDFVTDVGSWSIKVTTTDGMQHSFSGSMGIKPYHQLTKQIQKLVPISNLEVMG